MTLQEYKTIRDLAWIVLINAHINEIPVDVSKIFRAYKINKPKTPGNSRFDKALAASSSILNFFGLNPSFDKMLAVRILAPMIVVREIKIKSAEQLAKVFDLPHEIAAQRFERFEMLESRNKFLISNLEKKVLQEFQPWIQNYSG
ncbi:MAG: hypothetical protein KH231_07640 [Dialister sp.]|uniref:hypothetical protein n=1 Tax=Dialister sp. TaxID=1955814 RepID=UPI001DE3B2C1|nr:hypothetical protein [Dialister sp.]MBS6715320.1 hypothetical protein [Dialister sp.]